MSQLKQWILQLPPGWIEDEDQTITNEMAVKCEPLPEDFDNPYDLPADANENVSLNTDQTVSEQDFGSRHDDLDNEMEEIDPLKFRDFRLVDSKDFASYDPQR